MRIPFFSKPSKVALIKKGISSNHKVFTGPKTLQLDLTDFCANRCIGCWTHSPLLTEEMLPKKRFMLPFEKVAGLVNEFKKLNIEEIHLAGAGDPLLHPQIISILTLLKEQGFRVNLNTALYPIPDGLAEKLVELKIDLLTASIWAGDSSTWESVHPGVDKAAFKSIENFFIDLKEYKNKKDYLFPRVKVYHVLSTLNYKTINQMAVFAQKSFADDVEFQIMDSIESITRHLSINQSHLSEVISQFKALKEYKSYTKYFIGPNNELNINTFNVDQEQKEFGRLVKPLKKGFTFMANKMRVVCPAGKESEKFSWISPHPYPRLNFEFPKKSCRDCSYSESCYPSPTSVPIEIGFLNVKGVGSLLRRLNDLTDSQEHKEVSLVNKIPCTIGWHFARLMSNGELVPCCKAHQHPLGSINKGGFEEAWNSKIYKEFRYKSKNLRKTDSYFSKINCLKGCDNVGMNLDAISNGWVDKKEI